MSILTLPRRSYEALKGLNPSAFRDIAYKRTPTLASYLMTPYKLKELYGLNGKLAEGSQNKEWANALSRSPFFYYTDLGDVNTLGSNLTKLQNLVTSATYPPVYANELFSIESRLSEDFIKSRKDSLAWYGYRMPEAYEYVAGVKKQYPKLAEANEFFDRFEDELRINPETDVPRPRTLFTSRPTGVFTFARVAPTLYTFPCYKVEETDEKCISPSQVIQRDNRYFLASAEDVEVGIYGRETRDNGVTKARTQAKKVYATKENKIKVTPFINIYVNVVAPSGIKANDYRYNSFAAIALAKLLIANGFKISITSVFFAEEETVAGPHTYLYDRKDPYYSLANGERYVRHKCIYVSAFRVKDYSELLDFNTALIYGGDPAFFRYDMFKAHTYAAYCWQRNLSVTLGTPLTDEAQIDAILDRYNINNVENETRVIVSGRFSENAAADAVRAKLASLRLIYGGAR